MMKRPDLRVTAFASDVVSLMIWRSCSTVWIRLAICQWYVSHSSSGTSFHSGIRLNASQLTLVPPVVPPSRSDPVLREPVFAQGLSKVDVALPAGARPIAAHGKLHDPPDERLMGDAGRAGHDRKAAVQRAEAGQGDDFEDVRNSVRPQADVGACEFLA